MQFSSGIFQLRTDVVARIFDSSHDPSSFSATRQRAIPYQVFRRADFHVRLSPAITPRNSSRNDCGGSAQSTCRTRPLGQRPRSPVPGMRGDSDISLIGHVIGVKSWADSWVAPVENT